MLLSAEHVYSRPSSSRAMLRIAAEWPVSRSGSGTSGGNGGRHAGGAAPAPALGNAALFKRVSGAHSAASMPSRMLVVRSDVRCDPCWNDDVAAGARLSTDVALGILRSCCAILALLFEARCSSAALPWSGVVDSLTGVSALCAPAAHIPASDTPVTAGDPLTTGDMSESGWFRLSLRSAFASSMLLRIPSPAPCDAASLCRAPPATGTALPRKSLLALRTSCTCLRKLAGCLPPQSGHACAAALPRSSCLMRWLSVDVCPAHARPPVGLRL